MYEVTVNGDHVASGGTFLAARNVLVDYLYNIGSTDLAQNVEWSTDAECMVDCKEWNDDATVAIIEYVEDQDMGDHYTGPTYMEYDEESW